VYSNQVTHFAQSFHSVFTKGPFALSNNLLHDVLHNLLAINSPRVSVVLFMSDQDSSIVGQFDGLSRRHVRGAEHGVEDECRWQKDQTPLITIDHGPGVNTGTAVPC